jgi:hypothetical protein
MHAYILFVLILDLWECVLTSDLWYVEYHCCQCEYIIRDQFLESWEV